METSKLRKRTPATTLLDPAIVGPALGQAFLKLDPRSLVKNPVMFVLEIVTILTTMLLIRDIATGATGIAFELQIVIWLWFTVLFANLAEAVAEGRGKAQAELAAPHPHADARQARAVGGQHRAVRRRLGRGARSRRHRRVRAGRHHSG